MSISFIFIYQGTCNILDSFTLTNDSIQPQLCFDSSATILLYVLFPGQKIFLSVYHPTESVEPRRVTGAAVFKANIMATVKESLAELHHCASVERNIFSIRAAHKKYEHW